MIPLSTEQHGAWKQRVTASQKLIEKYRETWQKNVAAFAGQPLDREPKTDQIIVNKDFPRVKQKQSQLFFQSPEVQLKARREDYQDAGNRFQPVLNFILTRKIMADKMMDEVLTDVLCPSGIGVSKIGYQATVDGTSQVPSVDVSQMPPEQQLQMMQAGQIEMLDVPKIIHEEYFWRRVSPAKVLIPVEFGGSNYDDAPWLGFEFRMSLAECKALYKLPADFDGKASRDENLLAPDREISRDADENKSVKGWEIWYKASLFDPKVKHPQRQRRLVMIEGFDTPAAHDDSPYQKFDEDTGKLVVGFTKFPIRILTLTYVPDSPIPPSDCTITRPQVAELWKGRTQMVKQRDRSIPLRWFDVNQVDTETADKLEKGEIQEMIPLQVPGDRALGEIARAQYPRETFEFDNIVARDMDEAWMMGSNQLGSNTRGDTTAKEVGVMQSNISIRLDYERAKVLRYYVEGAELVGSLLQMFADDEDYIEVLGEDGTKRLQTWDKTKIAGEFVFDAKPDSAIKIDAHQDRQQSLNLYQLLANDPHINRLKLVESVIRKHNLDPAPIIVPQPPPKPAADPAITYRFAGEDLNPLNPSFAIVMQILEQAGIKIDPKAIQEAQTAALNQQLAGTLVPGQEHPAADVGGGPRNLPSPPHEGAVKQVEPLSKHQVDGKGWQ